MNLSLTLILLLSLTPGDTAASLHTGKDRCLEYLCHYEVQGDGFKHHALKQHVSGQTTLGL